LLSNSGAEKTLNEKRRKRKINTEVKVRRNIVPLNTVDLRIVSSFLTMQKSHIFNRGKLLLQIVYQQAFSGLNLANYRHDNIPWEY
jgi:hypothetical protein